MGVFPSLKNTFFQFLPPSVVLNTPRSSPGTNGPTAPASTIFGSRASTNSLSSLLVDARDPNIVLAGAVGPFVPGDERGVFKTTDGGKNWKKVFFKDGKTPIFDMCADPDDNRTVYAATGTLRFNPNDARPTGPGSEIFKSSDEGSTWQQVGAGLPEQFRGRIGIAGAPGT